MPLLLATLSLPAGFAVAELTGVRSLGGLVLALLAAAAVVAARAHAPGAAAFFVVIVVLFALAHLLADPLGEWGAVAAVAIVAGAAARLLLLGRD